MKKILFLSVILMFVLNAWGQISEGFESGLPTSYSATTSYTLSSGTWTGQANGVIKASGVANVNSGTGGCQLRNQTGAQITSPNITNGVGTVTFWASSSTDGGRVQVNYSTDGGITWIPAPGSPFSLTTGALVQKTMTINNASPTILIQFYRTASTVYIDDVTITTYVLPGPPVITSSLANVTLTYGSAIPSYTITASNSPASFAASGLPPGLAINTTSGIISGTPTETGTFTVSITATNGLGTSTAVTKNYIINKKALSITGLTSSNKVYDRNTLATLTGSAVLSGLVFSDAVMLSGTPVSNYSQSNVGTNLVITTTGYTISGVKAVNYILSQPSVTNRSITSKPLTIVGLTANDKVYNGTAAATLSGTAVLSGIVSPDVINISGTPVAVFNSATVGIAKPITVSGYSITGAQAANYALSQPSGLTASITKASQAIIFDILPDQILSANTFTVSAISSSGLTVIYTSSNPAVATISGNTVTMLSVGATVITASQVGNTNYLPADNIEQTQIILAGVPQINVEGDIGSYPDIANGNMSPNTGNNTQFAAQVIGASQTKGFRIQNLGGSMLNVSSITITGAHSDDFVVTGATPFAISPPNGILTFSVTFSPTSSGLRTAVVNIANNDSDNSPFLFAIQGTGNCGAIASTITPSSGPVGTEVTITAISGNLSGATVSFNGIASASVTQVSPTIIKAIVPAGAITGGIIATNNQGCNATNAFTVIDQAISSCGGVAPGAALPTDLFISQVTDHSSGGHSYIEIYNGTGTAVNLSGYTLRIYHNGSASPTTTLSLSSLLENNSMYLIAVGGSDATANYGGHIPNLTSGAGGVNNDDNFRLYRGADWIDVWGDITGAVFTISSNNYNYTRKNSGITAPSTTWDPNDWNAATPVSYSNIGAYDFSIGIPPTVISQPEFLSNCSLTSLSVTGAEGFTGIGDTQELAYQWFVAAPGSMSFIPIINDALYSGATASTLSFSSTGGLGDYQYYAQIRESDASCYVATNAVKIGSLGTINWDGDTWIGGIPNIYTDVIIAGNYSTALGSFEARSLVNNGNVTIVGNSYIKLQNELSNNGNFTILNNGSLVQVCDEAINSGTIIMHRDSQPMKRFDYTYWSSPVASYTLRDVSPTTPVSKFMSWNAVGQAWEIHSGGNIPMEIGKGYIVRAPIEFSISSSAIWTALFTGVPNNGSKIAPIVGEPSGSAYNLIGNPYPSAISADDFLNTANNPHLDATIYFWTHSSSPTSNFVYESDDYGSYNFTGGTATAIGVAGGIASDGFIAAGQAFFIKGLTNGNAFFSNQMRVTENNAQFFRSVSQSSNIAKNRIWLNLTNAQGAFNQALVGYIEGATNAIDRGFDGEVFGGNYITLYSIANQKKLTIQGRGLPFDVNDQVILGYKSSIAGTFKISIDHLDGLFDHQNIYLEDKMLNVIHDLKQSDYEFASAIGTFNDRFVLRYTNESLGNSDWGSTVKNLFVLVKHKVVTVVSPAESLREIAVFDLLGRKLYEAKNLKAHEFQIANLAAAQQALIVKIQLENGIQAERKIMIN